MFVPTLINSVFSMIPPVAIDKKLSTCLGELFKDYKVLYELVIEVAMRLANNESGQWLNLL